MNEGNVGVGVRFWKDAYRNEAKSKEAGRPVFDTVDWCEIRVLAERDTVRGPVHKMLPDPRQRFPQAWAKYQQDNASEGLVGTPLREVPWLEAGEIENLRYSRIHTLEQLAQVSDANITPIPGGLALREKAREFVKHAKDSAPLQSLAAENASLKSEVAELRSQVAELLDTRKRRRKADEEN